MKMPNNQPIPEGIARPAISTDIAISVENLTKKYRVFAHPGDRIKQALTFGRVRFHRDFTALRDVSFEIKKGESIGIIGRNGSGKSTLLQLICGILKPTAGKVKVNGRISALLELGAGFNPEFTGRENAYFQGSVMGLTSKEMDERFDDIAAFADIGEFIDQPIRTYSSGMYIRLAFATAIHVEPEILVIDEALAVGDAQFQSQCFHRMQDIRNSGGTILFVSHASEQVSQLCDRAILIDDGEVLTVGASKLVVGYYQKLLFAPPGRQKEIREHILRSTLLRFEQTDAKTNSGEIATKEEKEQAFNPDALECYDQNLATKNTIAYESLGAFIESPEITTMAGIRVNTILSGNTYRYAYTVRFDREAKNVQFGMLIKTCNGVDLGGASTAPTPAESISTIPKDATVLVEFQFNCLLNPGVYFLNAGVTGSIDGFESILHRLLDAEVFRVVSPPDNKCSATSIINFGCESRIRITPPAPSQ